MIYSIDTNVWIKLRQGRERRLRHRLRARPTGDIGISVVVWSELRFGALNSRTPDTTAAAVETLSAQFTLLPLTPEDCEAAAEVRLDLTRRGCMIGPYDVLIAGQALARGLTLVTANEREFRRVDGLRVENWLA